MPAATPFSICVSCGALSDCLACASLFRRSRKLPPAMYSCQTCHVPKRRSLLFQSRTITMHKLLSSVQIPKKTDSCTGPPSPGNTRVGRRDGQGPHGPPGRWTFHRARQPWQRSASLWNPGHKAQLYAANPHLHYTPHWHVSRRTPCSCTEPTWALR